MLVAVEEHTGTPAHLPMLPISVEGLCHHHSPREHETSVCPDALKPEQALGQAGMGGGALLMAPWHTLVSTQWGTCL